jgi:hypothetical protein
MLSRKAGGDLAYFSQHDREVREAIAGRLKPDADFIDEMLTDWPVYVRRMDLTRFLVRLDFFKMAMEVPGSFVEAGVYKGEGLMTWAKLLDIFAPGDTMRRIAGFDNFAGFADFHEADGMTGATGDKHVGGWSPAHAKADLEFFIEMFQKDRFVPRSKMIELVEGDIRETAPAYAAANPGFRVALLNLDVDLYEPTLAALEAFYPLMPPGGIVLVDEYGVKAYPGPARAIETYFGDAMPKLRKHPLYTSPGAYFVKGA